MNFSELTIVCVTYGRPKYVGRLIEYWQAYFDDATIYILDGSEKKLDDKYLNKIYSKNINYIHMQNSSIWKRYIYIKEILKTKYFHMVADDEIFVKSGINSCLEFLESNSNYSACCGKMILFTPLLKKEVFAFSPYKLYSNDNPIGKERVKTWLVDTQPNTIYSIIRSENLLKILNEISKFDENTFSKPEVFHEDLVECGLAFQGKTKIINDLMWLRSVENESIRLADDKTEPEVALFDNEQKSKKIFFDNFIESYLANLVTKVDNLDTFDFKNFYYKRLEMMRKHRNSHFYLDIFKLSFIKRRLFLIIPKFIKKKLIYYLRLNGPEMIEFLENNNENIKFDKNEVLDIKKFILNFYNNEFYK